MTLIFASDYYSTRGDLTIISGPLLLSIFLFFFIHPSLVISLQTLFFIGHAVGFVFMTFTLVGLDAIHITPH